ncbi:hypothetical protein N7508_005977 [Penicillium antarcticum]|uniref:uncharacterized protein n=1 Tax=Penicillium antarcticum TaxID=416450 RepID=UPI00239C883C|nr:uncharacterized protein N7508_005977 [Penicillium antarcticum]KAJ5306962.1 hypothetical protein N7508_005977 [Penicillium antarcticum]
MISEQNWRPGKRVAIAGGGPGAISTGLAFLKRGYDVRIFERQPECKAIRWCCPFVDTSLGDSAILRAEPGQQRVQLPFNKEVERRMGIKGWHYGVLRSSIFKKILDLMPEGITHASHEVTGYTELEDGVEVEFRNGAKLTADILIGADGIRSPISHQAFGEPGLFYTGIRLWLAWCDYIPGIPESHGVISHDWQYQASFFPMLHDGKPGFEWWVVEPSWEEKPLPDDPKQHLSGILKGWQEHVPRFLEATNFDTRVYRWEIYNRPSM